ncbi:hypothetical protein ACEPAI_2768 [Sanghuangporus weigelae]
MGRISKANRARRKGTAAFLERRPFGDKTNSQDIQPSSSVLEPSSIRQTRSISGEISKLSEELQTRKRELTKVQNDSLLNESLQSTVDDLEESIRMLQNKLDSSTNALTKTSNRLHTTETRLKRYMNGYFNARKALERSRVKELSLEEGNRSLNDEIIRLKSLLVQKGQEEQRLLTLCKTYQCMFDSAHLRSMDHWNRYVISDNRCMVLASRESNLVGRVSHVEKQLEESRRMNHRLRSRLAHLALDAVLEVISSFLGPTRCKKKRKVVSARTVGRIITEGGVMSMIHVGYDLKQSASFTSGGDGTTNKHQNFESMNVNLMTETYRDSEEQPPEAAGAHRVRFLKLEHTANHRSETQKKTFVNGLQEAIDTFNRSPLGISCNTPGEALNEEILAMKYTGTHGDHAEDQKAKHRLLGEWKHELSMRGIGAQYFHSKPKEEQELLTIPARTALIERLGGEAAWQALPEDEKARHEKELLSNICESLYAEAFERLSSSEKQKLNLWVWTGCCMHKDLNAVKGGEAAMRAKWAELGVAPVPLPNKDNAAVLDALGTDEMDPDEDDLDDNMDPFNASEVTSAAMLQSHQMTESGTAQQQHHLQNSSDSAANVAVREVVRRALDVTQGGGCKLCRLMAKFSNDKDDKKGEHHSIRDYICRVLGLTITFPDVTNTRYSSYLEASVEMLVRRATYLDYMQRVRHLREKRKHNNLELNILKGLTDFPTLTELAVMALYREAISISYISSVRGSGMEKVNALEMGSLHEKLKTHLRALINNPSIILAPDADPQKATLGGSEVWKSADAELLRPGNDSAPNSTKAE